MMSSSSASSLNQNATTIQQLQQQQLQRHHHQRLQTPPTPTPTPPTRYRSSLWWEAQAIFVGTFGAFGLRLLISQLSNLAMTTVTAEASSSSSLIWQQHGGHVCSDHNTSRIGECSSIVSAGTSAVLNSIGMLGARLARAILWLLPAGVAVAAGDDDQESTATTVVIGFIFANVWLLLWIRHFFHCYAHLPTRLCEAVMGRLPWRRFLFLVLPIHVLGTFMIGWLCQTLPRLLQQINTSSTIITTTTTAAAAVATTWSQMALAPPVSGVLVDSPDNHTYQEQLMLLFRESLVTTCFIVIVMVLPELLRVNRLPIWPCGFVLYPLYSYSLDAHQRQQQQQQTTSTFHPVLLLTLTWLAAIPELLQQQLQQVDDDDDQLLLMLTRMFGNFDWIYPIAPNLIGSMLGGLMAGLIMRMCFPD